MLRKVKSLEGYKLCTSDGDLGSVADFLLDDERWTVRYLVATTGGFLSRRPVLISPISFRQADWYGRRFHLALTKDKIRGSPGIDLDKPVSRQHESNYHGYYGYSYYWGHPGIWGMGDFPGLLAPGSLNQALDEPSGSKPGDAHLRSAKEVRGYHIQGSDEAVGHIEGFFVDEETWQIRYLAIDTGPWLFGKKVLIAPHWVKRIDWDDRRLYLDLSREAIKSGPAWNGVDIIDREYETLLHHHYGHPAYWDTNDHGFEPYPKPGQGHAAKVPGVHV